MLTDSCIPGFYRLSVSERINALAELGVISPQEVRALQGGSHLLTLDTAEKMIENVVGIFGLPFAVAPNFLINGRECVVPMVVEEPSIVAGVSGAAKMARAGGGFQAEQIESLLAGQIQLIDIDEVDTVIQMLVGHKDSLLDQANTLQPRLVARGGGARDIEFFKYRLADGQWTVVLHILVDTCDAMGANIVNSVCESIAPAIESLSGGRAVLKILSNLAERSLATARVVMPLANLATDNLSGEEVRDRIVVATRLAEVNPYRAATHNKGIMNGVDAVAIATGNDWRAIEAAAHAYAVKKGAYRSLSRWSIAANGDLAGWLQMPIKIGIVGGSLQANPGVALGLRIAAANSATELACMMVAVGLAQNFAALRALATDGIQKGHMGLHARSVAASVGVAAEHFDAVVAKMIESGDVKAWKAEELAAEFHSAVARDEADSAGQWAAASVGVAAGKVILLGEHAAVYDKHVLALPLPDAVTARVLEQESATRLILHEQNVVTEVNLSESGASGIAAALALIMRRLKTGERHFAVRIESRIPVAMGLGASASFAVAIIRGFDALLNLGMHNRDVDQLAFDCEKLAHGTPSGIDNNLATYGQPVLFSKSRATRTKPIDLAEAPPIVIAASGVHGSTLEQVQGVRARHARHPALYDTIFDEIDEMSIAGAAALRRCDYDALGSLMNVCHGLLNAIEVSTPELEKLVQIARQHGATGAKLTGAGGGGSIVALCPGCEKDVAAALRTAGCQIIRLKK
ncbi:MAG: hydroxymethylglutaryl-CoA reductase, degradative [Gammaproteobacteria bacterium]|nr:hydroxymethylglutaryl-CoA reductase, degradative [Gammaproteobacteria bacterium]